MVPEVEYELAVSQVSTDEGMVPEVKYELAVSQVSDGFVQVHSFPTTAISSYICTYMCMSVESSFFHAHALYFHD